jgi:hypothetical protein
LGKTSGSAFSFFAIHHDPVSRGKEYVISSAGFWFQHAVSEAILTTHPRLRDEDRPFMKGIVIFHLGTSAIYSVAAFARIGPRPTRHARHGRVARQRTACLSRRSAG